MNNNAKRITVSLTPETYAQIIDIARASGVSISWVMRYSAERLIADRRTGQTQQLPLPIEREIRVNNKK